ncbi:MAG: anthranilate synthase component I [Gammaproteobacteria bacterium]
MATADRSAKSSRDQFVSYAGAGYNRVPVFREVLADLDTPLSAYAKLARGPYSYLFESVQGGEKWGRYSIIGLPAKTVLTVRGHDIRVTHDGREVESLHADDPLDFIEQFERRQRVPRVEGLPRFTGGLVGYFGYDTVRYVEKKLAATQLPDPIGTPDILLMLSEEVVVFDNLRGAIYFIVHADPTVDGAYEAAQQRLDALHARLREAPLPEKAPVQPSLTESDFASSFPQPDFERGVARIKDYVLAGDIMQVVLSQRMTVPFSARPIDLYRALRYLNPSPYLYFLDLGDFQIVGSSPEILARLADGVVTVRPIAGTRKRGRSEEEDVALEKDLLADPKEIAEHLMLIDLGRNDVGRIADTGSVAVTAKMAVERYSHVMHIVSNVEGRLKAGMSALDVLRATHPAGTLSGAPKIRAMEIIDELEPVKRGIYGGAVGYIGWDGNMDTAIAIRTAVIKDGKLHIQAGAGVVADSVPRLEWEETMNKGRAMFVAVAMAQSGLKP